MVEAADRSALPSASRCAVRIGGYVARRGSGQPGEHVGGVPVGREDRVEHLRDAAALDDQREALDQGHALDLEGGQRERPREAEPLVAQQLERQVEPVHGLALVRGVLCAEAEHAGPAGGQLSVVVAERARLRRAAARARDLVPAPGRVLVGAARARVHVHDGLAGEPGQVHEATRGGGQRDRRHRQAGQVLAGAVVDRRREVSGQLVEVVVTWHAGHSRRVRHAGQPARRHPAGSGDPRRLSPPGPTGASPRGRRGRPRRGPRSGSPCRRPSPGPPAPGAASAAAWSRAGARCWPAPASPPSPRAG